jgi:endonuclease/exonuclease/phosphatase family metal-dependent hydrolase
MKHEPKRLIQTSDRPKRKVSAGRKFLRFLLGLILAVILIVAVYVAYVFLSYHRIDDNTPLEVLNVSEDMTAAQVGQTYTAVTYNVGFGAYTPDYTFFMDGGTSSWAASEESVIDTIHGAASVIQGLDPDLVLFEEIDLDATRSYHVDESALFQGDLSDYCYVYAIDYDSPFLFYPLTQPHGKSLSAIATYSKFEVTSSLRRSFPISTGVSKLVDLDRCYSVSRIPVENGKELVVYALHMSAYGNSDAVREGQMLMLKEDMEAEVAAGNYVICGGDFNHNLLAADDETDAESWAYPYPRSYLPDGMHFCIDQLSEEEVSAMAPTTRNTDIPYDPEESLCLTIDGFIISDNIQQVSYGTVDTGFLYSDHNPVQLTFQLME